MLKHRFRTSALPRLRARIAAILFAAAVVLVVAAPAQAATRAPDPVLVAITKALAAKQVTPFEARSLRLTWAASERAARIAKTTSRRGNIAAARRYAANLARTGGLTGERLEPVLLSVKATTYVMLKGDYPSHEEEVTIPGEVLVFTYYSGRGVQLQPFETLKQGMRELNVVEPDVVAARAIADRLLGLSVARGSSVVWEYHFAFGGPARPWTSAISQALATEFFHRVATLVPAAERAPYDAAAAGAANSFLRSTTAGGVGVVQGKGRFYVMYSFNPGQRILNGHLQALINVNRYATATGSKAARAVVSLGATGALALLPKFDTGAWSNYQPGQEAELGYHEFQSDQLVTLGDETGNPTFQDFGARFTQYLETPPTISIAATSWPSIIPARDGFRDRATIAFTLDKRAKVTMVVFDPLDREVKRISISRGRGAGTIIWDGTDASGATVLDGDYRAELTVTDVAGNRAFGSLSAPLIVERDRLAPELKLLTMRSTAATTSLVTANVLDPGSAWVVAEVRIGGKLVASRKGRRSGTIVLRVPRSLALVKKGVLTLRDASGNEFEHRLAG